MQTFEINLRKNNNPGRVCVKLHNDISGSMVMLTVIFAGPKAKPNKVNQASSVNSIS